VREYSCCSCDYVCQVPRGVNPQLVDFTHKHIDRWEDDSGDWDYEKGSEECSGNVSPPLPEALK